MKRWRSTEPLSKYEAQWLRWRRGEGPPPDPRLKASSLLADPEDLEPMPIEGIPIEDGPIDPPDYLVDDPACRGK